MDGASSLRILRKITFPLLLPISLTAILIRGLETLRSSTSSDHHRRRAWIGDRSLTMYILIRR